MSHVENTKVMPSFKQQNSTEGHPPDRGKRYALWFYQEYGGGRTYFRIAPLGWALLLGVQSHREMVRIKPKRSGSFCQHLLMYS